MTNKKIFIVDDDRFYLELMKFELGDIPNVEVITFNSAEKCIPFLDEKPELILLDFNLDSENPNNMSGHDALDVFKKKVPSQKIVFISGEENTELLNVYDMFRSTEFIVKSEFSNKIIRQKVNNLLSKTTVA